MRGAERVVFAFHAAREIRRRRPVLPQGRHAFAPPGEDLVRIGLVADIPHEPVFGRVEHIVQRHGQLDGSQVGRQMPAGAGNGFEQVVPQLLRELVQLLALQCAQVGGGV